MEQNERIDWIMLGTLCLMPAIFFWLINGLPIDLHLQSIPILGGATKLEFLLCAYLFPLISIGLGWMANRRCDRKALGLLIVVIGLLELLAAGLVAILSAGF